MSLLDVVLVTVPLIPLVLLLPLLLLLHPPSLCPDVCIVVCALTVWCYISPFRLSPAHLPHCVLCSVAVGWSRGSRAPRENFSCGSP